MNPEQEVVLGYLDETENVLECDDDFPSFAAGLPVFLHDESSFNEIKCLVCKNTMKFLLQIYAPLNFPYAFHRVLYVFMCLGCTRNPLGIRVFRMQSKQLPQQLKFSKNQDYLISKQPPFAISTETVSIKENKEKLKQIQLSDDEDNQQIQQIQYNKEEFEELQGFEDEAKDNVDKSFLIYQHFVMEYYNHILRYCFHPKTTPMWFSDKKQVTPNETCKFCKKQKHFEFQINNSISSFYKEIYLLDWGALYVYSCPLSCQTNEALVEETVQIQYDDLEAEMVDTQNIQAQLSKPNKQNPKKEEQQEKIQQNIQKKEDSFESDDW